MQKDPQISCPPEEFFRLEELHSPDYQLITPAGKVFSREAYLGAQGWQAVWSQATGIPGQAGPPQNAA